MKVAQRLNITFGVLILFVAAVGYIGFSALQKSVEEFIGIDPDQQMAIRNAVEIGSYVKRAEGHLLLYLNLHDEIDRDKVHQRIQSLTQLATRLDHQVTDAKSRELVDDINSYIKTIGPSANELFQVYDKSLVRGQSFEPEKYEQIIRLFHDKTSSIRKLSVQLANHLTSFLNRQLSIQAANEISSFSKRAEGHMLMYLMFQDEIDREKFIKRHASMTDRIAHIKGQVLHDEIQKIITKLDIQAKEMLEYGKQLINTSQEDIDTVGKFVLMSQEKLLRDFHVSSSLIRKGGIELANISINRDVAKKQSVITFAEGQQLNIIVLSIVSVLAAIFLAYINSRAITVPLKRLEQGAIAIGAGVFSTRVAINTRDEYGNLGKVFNKMTQELETNITVREQKEKAIIALNEDLEKRVRERTNELRALQQKALRKERLVAVGQVTATVSHELRNPLGTIRTSLYSLNRKIDGKDLKLDKIIARIERNVDRCDGIISELLDFSRIQDLKQEPVAIDPWLQKVIDEFGVPEDVTLQCDLASAAELSLDKERFRRVVVNILSNAMAAVTSDAHSVSRNRDRLISVKTQVSDDWIIISVIDTGPGMSADILKKVFEPLFSTKSFGVGLGLPMVQNIMLQHGGKIIIDSQEGEGTRVDLKLPRSKTEMGETI